MNWRGKPLTTYRAVVELIRHQDHRLTGHATYNPSCYPTRQKIIKLADDNTIPLHPHV